MIFKIAVEKHVLIQDSYTAVECANPIPSLTEFVF